MNTHRLETEQQCPRCHKTLDAVAGATTDKPPKPGDYSICGGCLTVLRFGDGLALRVISDADIPLQLLPVITRARRAAGAVRASMN